MNSHSWTIASVPAKSAGPIERAGLTDVPVAGIATKWIIGSARPIASGASAGCSLRSSVTARITSTKISGQHQLEQEAPPTRRSRCRSSPKQFWPELPSALEALEAVQQDEEHQAAPRTAPASWAAM